MSEEHPKKPLNGKSDEPTGDKSSEKYRSNSRFNGSLNVNFRSLGINTKLTFGNHSSTSRDARSISSGTHCRCASDGNETGSSGSLCYCLSNGAGNHFNRGIQPRSSSHAGYNSFRNDLPQRNSNRLKERHHSLDNDIGGSTSYGSPHSQKSVLFTGTRPKQRVSGSPDFGGHFDDTPNYQATPWLENTKSHFGEPYDYSRNFENSNQRFNDAFTQQELEFILGNAHSSVSNRRGSDDLVHSSRDVTRVSDNTYDLNGLQLSGEELEFVLNQTSPTSDIGGPAFFSDNVEYPSSTNNNFVNLEAPIRESGARPLDFQHTQNGANPQMKFRRHPATTAEKLLASSSLELLELPWADDEDLSKCPICLGGLQNVSPAQTSSNTSRGLLGAVMLANCGHAFHCCCLLPLLTTASESFSCPLCRTVHGAVTGTQPPGGTMSTSVEPSSLPGFQTARTIVILYDFPEGVQGPGHPNPGQPYHLKGFPRKAYLPDTPQGRQVASLLKKAFDRRLVFTVGHSESVGLDDCVIWGNISHKTLVKDRKFGYPDPNYLDNVTLELAALGIHENS